MAEEVKKNYSLTKNFILFLNLFIALVIIIASQRLASSPLGKISMIFGFVMITIATALEVLDKL